MLEDDKIVVTEFDRIIRVHLNRLSIRNTMKHFSSRVVELLAINYNPVTELASHVSVVRFESVLKAYHVELCVITTVGAKGTIGKGIGETIIGAMMDSHQGDILLSSL